MNTWSAALSVGASLFAAASIAQAAPIDAEAVTDAVQRAARLNLPDTVDRVEVHSVYVRGAVDVPSDASLSLRVTADPNDDWIGTTQLDLLVSVDGVSRPLVAASAEIVAWVRVPVLREPVARGETVRANHLSSALREADRLPGGVMRHAEQIVGRAAKRDLGLNTLVKSVDLGPAIDAERNRPVTLLVGGGALRVSASGVLREPGAVGDLVAVWVPSTRAVMHGILRSPDVVEVPRTMGAGR